MGKLSIRCWSTVVDRELRCVSTNDASAVTVTSWVNGESCSAIGRFATWPTVSTIPLLVSLLKPGASTESVYEPAGTSRKRYWPEASEVTDCSIALVFERRVTVACGTAAPPASKIIPLNCAPVDGDCARTITAAKTKTTVIVTKYRFIVLNLRLLSSGLASQP